MAELSEPFYLSRDGREPARWDVDTTAGAVTSVEIRLTRSSPWVAADYADGVASLWVRGPAFDVTDGQVSQLVTANCVPELRVHVGGAYVVRRGAAIILR